MKLDNVMSATWGVAPRVRTLITQVNTCEQREKGHKLADESTPNEFGFNIATHVGDKPEVVQARRNLLQRVSGDQPINWLTQVHGNESIKLDEPIASDETLEYDACFSFRPNRVCVVSTADCLPVLLSDEKGSFVSAIHAGWQGLYGEILGNTISRIREAALHQGLELTDFHAYIAPAISQENYQVDGVFRQRFVEKSSDYAPFFKAETEGKYLADLKGMASFQLRKAGVTHIQDAGLCTYEDKRFYSYRRSAHLKQSYCGRFASMIWMTS